MNRIFNLIWSKTKEKWIVVSEKVKGNGKVPTSPLFSVAVLTALFSSGGVAYGVDSSALPTGGQITSGSGTITSSGTTMTINQTTQQLIANWSTFNIGQNAAVRFEQPGIAAVALNRIADKNPSQIMGSLTSNGQVFLLNSSGIIFGKTATVNVGGLVASSLNLLDSDFLNGKYIFSNNGSSGAILNQGAIKALNGGVVALMAPKVTNEGSITANSGSAFLAAGNKVSLDFIGDGLINYTVDQGAVDALVENRGLIKADGGLVVMTAKAADALRIATATNSGVIEARTLQNKAGRILLLSDMENGQILVSGTLDASAPDGGNGGFIETSGGRVNISDGTVVTTRAVQGKSGTWLIDPTDFTIASGSGGSVDGAGTPSGNISGSTLHNALGAGNVTILSSQGSTSSGSGDINVNDAVSWSANLLTLTAVRDININAVMSATGSASLTMNTATANGSDSAVSGGTVKAGFNADGTFKGCVDFSGSGTLTINTHPYTIITTLGAYNSITGTDLQGIRGNLTGYYALGSNIDATATSGWNSGSGFSPISGISGYFKGTFDGLGHTISNLTVTVKNNLNHSSLFGVVSNIGIIRNVGLVTESVTGKGNVGGLVGRNFGTITNSYMTGSVTGSGAYVGGLVGYNYHGTISNSYAMGGVVCGGNYGGGLVGYNTGTISDSYATVNVTGSGYYIGGLVGQSYGSVSNSFYNMDAATILVGNTVNDRIEAAVTAYGINGTLFDDWLSTADGKRAKTLDITKYFTLSDGYYQITNISDSDFISTGNLRNILGFVNDSSTNKFKLTVDIPLPTGFWIPRFNAAELDGAGFTFTGLTINQPLNGDIGMIGRLGEFNPLSSINNLGVTDINVTASRMIGGLVGKNNGTITNSYATGSVAGNMYDCGGLVGSNFGTITNSYATGSVAGTYMTGGLVGSNYVTIANSYAKGSVEAADSVDDINHRVNLAHYTGGLVGGNMGGSISNSYATGSVVSTGDYVGALVGSTEIWRGKASIINDAYYESGINPSLTGVGDTPDVAGEVWGMSTAEMKLLANFTTSTTANDNPATAPAWDFTPGTGVWKIDKTNDGYPYLAWQSHDAPPQAEKLRVRPVVNGTEYQGAPKAPPPPIAEGQLLEATIDTPQSGSESGLISFTAPQNLWMPGSSFSFELSGQVKSALSGADVVTITLLNGNQFPFWLHYNAETMTFTAMDLPQWVREFKVLVMVDGKSWVVDVSMKPS